MAEVEQIDADMDLPMQVQQSKEAFLDELLNRTAVVSGESEPVQPMVGFQGTDTLLLEIWRETFGPNTTLDQNFFSLGGDSLKSIQISARARRQGLEVTMQHIIEYPTVRMLAAYLFGQKDHKRKDAFDQKSLSRFPISDRAGVAMIYPSTSAQEGIVFECLSSERDELYVSQFWCEINGPLNPVIFERALDAIVRRHPALRISFPSQALVHHGQLIPNEVALDYRYDEGEAVLTGSSVEELALTERKRPFDLGESPLLRVRLISLEKNSHIWIWTQHHLVADGRSQELLISELATCYQALLTQTAHNDGEDTSYCEALLDAHNASEDGQQFWTDTLAHCNTQSLFPTRAPGARSQHSSTVSCRIPEELECSLTQTLAKSGLTAGSAFAAWFAAALGATFDRRDLIIGLVTSGRHGEGAKYNQTVGNLVRTVPLRATLNQGSSLDQWTRSMQKHIAVIQQHERTSVQCIRRWVGWPGDLPLFNALFVHENFQQPHALFDVAGLHVNQVHFSIDEGSPLVLVCDTGKGITLTLRYASELVSDETAEQLLGYIRRLSIAWLENPTGADHIHAGVKQ